MKRRRQTTPAEALMDLIALLPWWAGVILAAVFYGVLGHIAAQPMPTATDVRNLPLAAMIGHSLATAGQYLLPLLALAGAGISAWRRAERRRLARSASGHDAAAVIDGMSWQQFERLVSEAFRQQGYRVQETGGGGADGGIDLVLTRQGEKHLVQCKQWRARMVGVGVVRELYGLMAARGAAGGFVVTSGRYSDEARAFASGRNVRLVDGAVLQAMLRQGGEAGGARDGRDARGAEPRPVAPAASARSEIAPPCPKCGKAMVRRKARTGQNAGSAFWGCSSFPACRGTRPI